MAEISLGVIQGKGSGPVRVTVNQDDPAAPLWCNRYRISHFSPSNTGQAYSGAASMVVATGDGVFGVLPAPAGTATLPVLESLSSGVFSMNVNLADVYIDTDNQTDQFLVSAMQV